MEYFIIARWLVMYAALFLFGLPIAARLLPTTDSRGAGLAIPIALLLISFPAYWIGQLPGGWGLPALLTGIVVLVGGGGLAAVDFRKLRQKHNQIQLQLTQTVYPSRQALFDTVIVFIISFAFIIIVRAFDPAVIPIGGEKFLDFGLLKTLSRSSSLPPTDFWFAGEPVKYYYGGHLTTTLLAWVTETPPRFAYNVALAGYYATLVTAAFEISGAIAETNGHARRVGGAAGAFFIGVAGNLLTTARLVVAALPASLENRAAAIIAQQTDNSAQNIDTALHSFSYWDASRVIDGTINEFPLFAWLNGDLHAHMLSTQTLLLAVGIGYAYYLTPGSQQRRRQALMFGALPLTAGWQAIQNTWSFPSVIALGGLAILVAPTRPVTLLPWFQHASKRTTAPTATTADSYADRVYQEMTRIGWTVGITIISGVIAVGFAAPFLFETATGSGQRTIEFLDPTMRSSTAGLFLVHGAFLIGIGGYLYTQLRNRLHTQFQRRIYIVAGSMLAIGTLIGLAWWVDLPVIVMTLPVLVAAWIGARITQTVGYEAVLIIGGAGLIILVELIYLNEQAGPGRMNTVFKTYAQVWVLWATAMGVAISGFYQTRTSSHSSPSATEQSSTADTTTQTDSVIPVVRISYASGLLGSIKQIGMTVVIVCLIISTSMYGVLAIGGHLAAGPPPGGPTLDATEFVDRAHPDEAVALDWIDNRQGQPTLLEAPGTTRYHDDSRSRATYSWYGNPAASLSGVPTVAGWNHEVGYRGRAVYRARVTDVDLMYTANTSTRAELFDRYNITYIWVGPSEHARYDNISFSMNGVSVAHHSGNVTIYAVDQSDIPSS